MRGEHGLQHGDLAGKFRSLSFVNAIEPRALCGAPSRWRWRGEAKGARNEAFSKLQQVEIGKSGVLVPISVCENKPREAVLKATAVRSPEQLVAS